MAKTDWKYVSDGNPTDKCDGWTYLVSWVRFACGAVDWESRDVCEALWDKRKGWVFGNGLTLESEGYYVYAYMREPKPAPIPKGT